MPSKRPVTNYIERENSMTGKEKLIWDILRANPGSVYLSSDKELLYAAVNDALITLRQPYGRDNFESMTKGDIEMFIKDAFGVAAEKFGKILGEGELQVIRS